MHIYHSLPNRLQTAIAMDALIMFDQAPRSRRSPCAHFFAGLVKIRRPHRARLAMHFWKNADAARRWAGAGIFFRST